MVKITSTSWVEKDDPMFTGRVTISSHSKKENPKPKKKSKEKEPKKKEDK